MPEPPLELC